MQVRPLDTRFGAEDRREYKVDLGAYFTAFSVAIENHTEKPVAVDPAPSTLQDPSGRVWPLLTGGELVQTYRRGGMEEGAIEILSKSPSVIKAEMERIRAVQLAPATLEPGARVEGVLLFPPIKVSECGRSVLTIRGIATDAAPRDVSFEFPLSSCADETGAPH